MLLVTLVTVSLLPSGAIAQDHDERIRQLIAEGDQFAAEAVRRYAETYARFAEADRLAANSANARLRAEARARLATGLFFLDRLTEAAAAGREAAEMARAAGANDLLGGAVRTVGSALLGLARFEEAEAALLESAEITSRYGTADGLARSWNNLAVNARMQGKLAEAIGYGHQALGVVDGALAAGEPVTPRMLFAAPFNLGKAMADSGDYLDSRAYLDRAFTTAVQHGDIGGQMHVLFDTGEWYEAQGDLARAERYYQRAVEFTRRHESGEDTRGKSLRGLGRIAFARGQVAEAVRYLDEAVTLLDARQQEAFIVPALVDLARARSAAGDHGGSARDLERAASIARARNQVSGLVMALVERAHQRLAGGRLDSADPDFAEAIAIADRERLLALAPAAWAGRASLAEARGNWIDALASYERAAAALDRLRGRIVSVDLRATFAAAAHSTFAGIVRVSLQLHASRPTEGYDAHALAALERERSHDLDHAVADAGVISPSLRAAEARIVRLQNALFVPDVPAERRQALLQALDDAERDLALEASVPARGGIAVEAEPRRLTVAAFQRALGPGETVVEYTAAAEGAAAVVITRSALHVVPLRWPADLDARIDFFVTALEEQSKEASIRSGRALAALLLDPVLAYVAPGTRLMIVTSGTLARLPFAALPLLGKEGQPTPLLVRNEVTLLPSLSMLEAQRRAGRSRLARRVLAVADAGNAEARARDLAPLPASRVEARAVAHPRSSSRILIGASATERAVKLAVPEAFSVVHLATHALLDHTVPERSAVLLGPSDGEDGLLQAREIYQLPVAGSLVVLSGCRTAGGQVSGAEGLRSLARAFLKAGGRTVLGSMWDVPDAGAAAIVMAFYSHLARGRDAGAALRAAQLSQAGSDPYATSRTWAAMVLTGEPALELESLGPSAAGAAPAAVLAALLLWLTGGVAWDLRRAAGAASDKR